MNTASLPAIRGFGPILRNRPFLALWLGQLFSQVADKIYFILMVDIVTALTGNNGSWTSLCLVAYTIPSVLFGAFAGALVDRWDKVRTQIVTNILRGLLIALVPLCNHSAVVAIILLSFLISTCSQPYSPAETATIPLVVPQKDLMAANSLFTTTVVGSIILGFTIGEPFIAIAGGATSGIWSAWSISGLYLISTIALLTVRIPPQPLHRHPLREIFDEFIANWGYIRTQRPVWSAIVRLVILFAMFAALSTVAILFAKQDLATNFSWLLATAGVGMAIGAGVIGRWGHRWNRRRMVNGGFAGAGIALLAMALLGSTVYWEIMRWFSDTYHLASLSGGTSHGWITVSAYLLTGTVGFAAAWVAIPNQTLLQEIVPADQRGKVFGTQNMATNIATALPMGGIGVMADWWGVRTLIALLGVVMLVAASGSHPWRWLARNREGKAL
ncbi:MAG: MFS transporter [Cyanobacteria bacterium NC_groundwater_1444_Ag_S-0.65um_54_12]|nr:MFS transporter [Cyanobacteria bacterium NC_groundwater_1444_Ag_S-0.65um_54_12]